MVFPVSHVVFGVFEKGWAIWVLRKLWWRIAYSLHVTAWAAPQTANAKP